MLRRLETRFWYVFIRRDFGTYLENFEVRAILTVFIIADVVSIILRVFSESWALLKR